MEKKLPHDRGNDHFISLLPQEVNHNMYDAVTTLATIFEGVLPLKLLQSRARKILEANPWLAARLCTDKQTGQPFLRVPDEPSVSPFFESVEVGQVCSTGADTNAVIREAYTPSLTEAYAGLLTKQGFKCLDRDEPLFKIRACVGNDGKFILLVSMSHVLLDGTTQYQIYRMLDPSSPVLSLKPERIQSIHEKLADSKCLPGSAWLPRSIKMENNDKYDWLMASNAARSTKESRALSGMPVDIPEDDSKLVFQDFSGGMFRINSSWLNEQKASFSCADKEVRWISSNDVLTSWFMRTSKTSAGLMAVNTRNRVSGLTTTHAGNYQVTFLYYPEEFADPCAIRKSVDRFSASSVTGSKAGQGESIAFISSWTQSYKNLDLGSECRLLMHLPLLPRELCPPTIFDSSMIVFCPREGELAAILWTNNLNSFLDGTALGKPLNPFC
jgi:hypothetical protein